MQVTVFTTNSCAPCNAMKPIIGKLRTEHKFDLTIIAATPNTQFEFTEKNIRTVPTVIVFDGSTEVARMVGGKTEAEIAEFLTSAGVIK